MEKTYQPESIEQSWYQQWEQQGYFSPSGKGPSYSIVIPPPNVTGSLHMGHGFQDSIMDALTRYHRMRQFNTLWLVGTDHAGIATQMVVERQLNNIGKTRHDLGRENFIKRIWEWKEESGGTITKQLRRLGASVDWPNERFTMDEDLSKIVTDVFIRLYDEGLIYRGQRLVNWDPVLCTAISDLEVMPQEQQAQLWHIKYPISNSQDYLTVATTRPETLFGDTAVAINPNDTRYQHLLGQFVELPLAGRKIPIIADDYVDAEFGSGVVKITPAHDFNDNAVGKRHQLPMINIFTPTATLNENVPKEYQGLDRFVARDKVIENLQALNLIDKITTHTANIPHGERSGVVVEPYLTDQWFVKAKTLAEPAIEVVKSGKIKFIPENWSTLYFQWLNNIEDWCISRQLWWGHRIPAWYDENNNIYVAENEQQIRQKYKLSADIQLRQDEDVLDTWFSAALWPFSTLGWPHQTSYLKSFYPTNVLVTGFDIIFFWVARMVMMGLKFIDEVPFKEVYITGLIKDADGQKMSKSKGNIIDPIDLIDGIDLESLVKKRTSNMMQPKLAKQIEQRTRQEFPDGIMAYGTDALRLTFCALATPGREIRFDIKRLAGYRNFCNKLWNAARFVMMNTTDQALDGEASNRSLIDRWLITRLQYTIKQAHEYFQSYRFDLLVQGLYEFVWNEYCDWYLEFSKTNLNPAQDVKIAKCTRHTLLSSLEVILRLLHPITPFITEEIWQRIAPALKINAPTIMLQAYPEFDASLCDEQANAAVEWIKQVVLGIRNIRGEKNISPSQTVKILCRMGNVQDKQFMQEHEALLKSLAKIESIEWLEANAAIPPSSPVLVGELEILIPLQDIKQEIARLEKEIAKLEEEKQKSISKLDNPSFATKAPPAVVKKEEKNKEEIINKLKKLITALRELKGI